MTFNEGTHGGSPVGRRNSQRCEIRRCQAGIAIKRSAANRFVVFGAAGALKNHKLSWRGDDAMHPLPILFDYRTRKFEPTRRSFDFIEVTAPSVRGNDTDVPNFVTNL